MDYLILRKKARTCTRGLPQKPKQAFRPFVRARKSDDVAFNPRLKNSVGRVPIPLRYPSPVALAPLRRGHGEMPLSA